MPMIRPFIVTRTKKETKKKLGRDGTRPVASVEKIEGTEKTVAKSICDETTGEQTPAGNNSSMHPRTLR